MEKFKLIVSTNLFIIKDDKILLSLRKNTGFADGMWNIVGGHLEKDEWVSAGAVREAKEEVGIIVNKNDLKLANVLHDTSNIPRIQFYFVCKKWQGEITYMNGRMYKVYRGMGSLEAMTQGARDRYGLSKNEHSSKLIPEGIVGQTLFKGKLSEHVHQLVGGIKAGLGYVGAKDIKELQKKGKFIQITQSSLRESHPHDISITKEAPNYQRSDFEI